MGQLQTLSAANNSIPVIADSLQGCTSLFSLDLSSNCLSSLSGVGECPRLVHLDVSRNVLQDVDPISECPLLQASAVIVLNSVDVPVNQFTHTIVTRQSYPVSIVKLHCIKWNVSDDLWMFWLNGIVVHRSASVLKMK